MKILDIKVDEIDLPAVVSQINSWLGETDQHFITTVNPEFVVAAQKNFVFKEILNRADISTVDGSGLVWAAKFLTGEKLERVTGVDLTLELLSGKCPQAQIYLLGGAPGVAEAVKIKYARENIVSAEDGGKLLGNNNELENNQAILDRINNSGANILLVAFGQIKQEMWLAENLPKLPNIKIAIGVGGTFDYLSGRAKRPPQWLRNLGLEWLYRLIKEPKRWKRIWNATAVFSWLVFRKKYHF
jgi:N-acetylglucosaminyldiphosphoundecaprenol N-acetyl-beta-D-mannosaminyltransferase